MSPSPGQAAGAWSVIESRELHRGQVFSLVADEVVMPDGQVRTRDVVHHPGAVGVVALRGEQPQVLLLRQYRHPVRRHLLELPAGLLDVAGETAQAAARRELAEEAGLAAQRWDVLVDAMTTPGMSDEAVRVFLARDISALPSDQAGFTRVDEEADLQSSWLPLDAAVAMVAEGTITNALCVMGLLAVDRAHARGWSGLRPADAPWPDRPTAAG